MYCQLKEYDYVMDDEIEFVQALPMAGSLNNKVSDGALVSSPSQLLYAGLAQLLLFQHHPLH